MREPRITIAGGGIGGMAAALLLARAGARVTLFERVPEPTAVGAAIALYPNGLAVLYGLGLRDDLTNQAYRAYSGTVGLNGRPVIEVPVPDFGQGLDHALALHRNRLFTVLAEAVAAEPGVDAHYGHEVTGAKPDGTVLVRAAEGAQDRSGHGVFAASRGGTPDESPVDSGSGGWEHPGDLVIAADGISSAVRASGDFGARRRRTHGVAARLIVPGEPFGEAVGENWSPYGIAITSRLGDGTSYLALSASRGPARAALLGRDLVGLRRLADAMAPGAESVLSGLTEEDLLITPIDTVACARWAHGRRVLLGDAAHAMTPHLGQGANTALLDAAVLAVELARRGDLRAAVAAYLSRRRRTADRVRLASRAYGLFNEGLTGRFTLPVRDGLLRLGARLPGTEGAVGGFMQEDPATTYLDVRALGR